MNHSAVGDAGPGIAAYMNASAPVGRVPSDDAVQDAGGRGTDNHDPAACSEGGVAVLDGKALQSGIGVFIGVECDYGILEVSINGCCVWPVFRAHSDRLAFEIDDFLEGAVVDQDRVSILSIIDSRLNGGVGIPGAADMEDIFQGLVRPHVRHVIPAERQETGIVFKVVICGLSRIPLINAGRSRLQVVIA